MTTHFIVHETKDNVGVVVVEKISAGQKVSGWIMKTDETITVKVLENISASSSAIVKNSGEFL